MKRTLLALVLLATACGPGTGDVVTLTDLATLWDDTCVDAHESTPGPEMIDRYYAAMPSGEFEAIYHSFSVLLQAGDQVRVVSKSATPSGRPIYLVVVVDDTDATFGSTEGKRGYLEATDLR